MIKSSQVVKVLASALIIFLLVEGISAIIGKSKGKRKKHKDDSDDYDDEGDQSCYPGRNCVPGCYCSGEYCRPYFPPKNKAEAHLKCKTFNYPQWSLSKKKKHKHKRKKHHHHKDLSESDVSLLVTKHNFSTSQPINEEFEASPVPVPPPIKLDFLIPSAPPAPVPSAVNAVAGLDVNPKENSNFILINNVSYMNPLKPVHPVQRNLFRLGND